MQNPYIIWLNIAKIIYQLTKIRAGAYSYRRHGGRASHGCYVLNNPLYCDATTASWEYKVKIDLHNIEYVN
jgi:hypothetical protein